MSSDYTQSMLDYIISMMQNGAPQPFEPYDVRPSQVVQDAQRRLNYAQDWLSVQADSSNSALAGPSAYSTAAFQPTSTYSRIDQPGYQQLMSLAARQDTPEGIIANGILQGSTAYAEIAKLQQAYNEAKVRGTLADDPILSLIPQGPNDQYGQPTGPDWTNLLSRMNDVEQTYMSENAADSTGQLFDPETGQLLNSGSSRRTVMDSNGNPVLVDVETTPSEQSQWYTDQGLSQPTDQYSAADFMGPDWQAGQANSWALQQAMIELMNPSTNPGLVPPDTTTYKTQFGAQPGDFGKGGAGEPAPVDNGWTDVNDYAPVSETGQQAPPEAGGSNPWWRQNAWTSVPQDLRDRISQQALDNATADYLLAHDQGAEPPDWSNGAPTVPDQASVNADANQRIDNAIAQMILSGEIDPTTVDWTNHTVNGRPVADPDPGAGAVGFMDQGAGLQQADPATQALVSQMAAQMTGGGGGGAGLHGMVRQLPMGGAPPTPPGGGAISTPADNGGMGPNAAPTGQWTPEQEQAYQDYVNSRANVGPPAPVPPPGNAQMGPIPGSPEWFAMQTTGFQGWPTATDALSYNNYEPAVQRQIGEQASLPQSEQQGSGGQQANLDYLQQVNDTNNYIASRQTPAEGDVNFMLKYLFGTGPWSETNPQGQQTPQPGALTIGDYLQQYVLNGGTANNYSYPGAPEQPEYNPLPGNQPGPPSQPLYNPLPQNPGAGPPPQPAYNPLATSGSWWQNAMGGYRPNDPEGDIAAAASPSWWEGALGGDTTATPQPSGRSWWQSAMGGGNAEPIRIGGRKSSKARRENQATLAQRDYYPKPRQRDSAELRQWRTQTQDVINRRRSDQQANYGADYGHAAAVAYLLGQAGVRPLDTQLAARRGSISQLGAY